MRIPELYGRGRTVFSFEFFPPKTERGADLLFEAIGELSELDPDFVSVTCPLEKSRRPLTIELVIRIRREVGVESMAHLVTVDYERDEMGAMLERLRANDVENVLALRGDLPEDLNVAASRDFPHAADLAAFALSHGFAVGGAAHPERHPESPDWESEMRHARAKVDAGCSFLVTQLFFDNADYFRYVERARAVGIEVPIVPGIMPVASVPGIERMALQNGNRLPEALRQELHRVDGDPAAVRHTGVVWATAQCEELLDQGVPGIHFYTLNRSPATREIMASLRRGRAS